MSIEKAVSLGLFGNELSKQIAGSNEVSAERTAVAVGAGAVTGAVAGGALIMAGAVAAPVTIPLAIGSAVVAGIASLFD
ncbi:hypothetical protein SAMN05421644_13332 [Allochromatium warmingii]|uniref:Uncharacterized protein n=1 Tax=Allochromatium warmingii TaxID=61595 RepID=A0A1H3HI36_ALLWA|nr:hypothetical protein [Allochromatium warmingii]SDY15111.1 hypothetical protein SAMN05421644_13332 [Allochromatium warmingii]